MPDVAGPPVATSPRRGRPVDRVAVHTILSRVEKEVVIEQAQRLQESVWARTDTHESLAVRYAAMSRALKFPAALFSVIFSAGSILAGPVDQPLWQHWLINTLAVLTTLLVTFDTHYDFSGLANAHQQTSYALRRFDRRLERFVMQHLCTPSQHLLKGSTTPTDSGQGAPTPVESTLESTWRTTASADAAAPVRRIGKQDEPEHHIQDEWHMFGQDYNSILEKTPDLYGPFTGYYLWPHLCWRKPMLFGVLIKQKDSSGGGDHECDGDGKDKKCGCCCGGGDKKKVRRKEDGIWIDDRAPLGHVAVGMADSKLDRNNKPMSVQEWYQIDDVKRVGERVIPPPLSGRGRLYDFHYARAVGFMMKRSCKHEREIPESVWAASEKQGEAFHFRRHEMPHVVKAAGMGEAGQRRRAREKASTADAPDAPRMHQTSPPGPPPVQAGEDDAKRKRESPDAGATLAAPAPEAALPWYSPQAALVPAPGPAPKAEPHGTHHG